MVKVQASCYHTATLQGTLSLKNGNPLDQSSGFIEVSRPQAYGLRSPIKCHRFSPLLQMPNSSLTATPQPSTAAAACSAWREGERKVITGASKALSPHRVQVGSFFRFDLSIQLPLSCRRLLRSGLLLLRLLHVWHPTRV